MRVIFKLTWKWGTTVDWRQFFMDLWTASWMTLTAPTVGFHVLLSAWASSRDFSSQAEKKMVPRSLWISKLGDPNCQYPSCAPDIAWRTPLRILKCIQIILKLNSTYFLTLDLLNGVNASPHLDRVNMFQELRWGLAILERLLRDVDNKFLPLCIILHNAQHILVAVPR